MLSSICCGALAQAAVLEPHRIDARMAWLDINQESKSGAAPNAASASRDAIVAAAERALAGQAKALSTDDSTSTTVAGVHAAKYGPYIVQYKQSIAGLEVWGARVNVLVDRDLTARAITGGFSPHAKAASPPNFTLDGAAAVQAAVRTLDDEAAATAPSKVEDAAAAAGYAHYRIPHSSTFTPARPARVKAIWYPAAERLVPAYYTELIGTRKGAARPLAYAIVVSADDGRVLASYSLIHDAQPFDYRVFANASGYPYFDPYGYTNPHPTGVADGYKPTLLAPMNLVTLTNAGIATGDPWLADDATETAGNNVEAFFNADTIEEDFCSGNGWGPGFNAAEGDFHASVSGPHRFDYTYDADLAPLDFSQCDDVEVPIPIDSTQLNAKIVQSFYAGNWLHDLFYDLGFDEAAGNAQADNYGRGGIEGDRLYIHAAFDGTFTYAPADGESPSVTFGPDYHSLSHRDTSAFDFGVFAHEWSHTMYGRLVDTSLGFGQDGAINEGTADFVGLFMMVREQDRYAMAGRPPFYGAYAVGAYMNRDYDDRFDTLPPAGSPGNPDNTYYHGIRRFPSSADLAINPLTFENIGLDHPLPADANAYDWKLRSLQNAEIHTAGEIWTAAVWQCARNLLAATPSPQFDEAHDRFLSYLVAGMKLFPANPTYTEARDALLFAIRADDEADYRRCRAGFAARGLGAGALSPPRDSVSLRGAVESFDDTDRAIGIVGVDLDEVSGGDGDGVLDRGELGRLTVTLKNTGLVSASRVSLYVPPSPARYVFPHGSRVTNIALAPEEERAVTFDVRIVSRQGAQEIRFHPIALDVQHPQAHAEKDASFRVNYDLVRDRTTDALAATESFAADWTHDFEESHGCTRQCLGVDDSSDADILDWERVQHLGEGSYTIGTDHMTIRASLTTIPFHVSASEPFKLTLRHDYDFDRSASRPAGSAGTIEISVDGGDWENAAAHLVSGPSTFTDVSGGWREDTLAFDDTLAGHEVRLRLQVRAYTTFIADDAHWAVSRVDIEGAAEPMFSSLHSDVN